MNHPVYLGSKRVSVYLSMDSEVQTKDIVNDIFESGKMCYIPKYMQTQFLNIFKTCKCILCYLGTILVKWSW